MSTFTNWFPVSNKTDASKRVTCSFNSNRLRAELTNPNLNQNGTEHVERSKPFRQIQWQQFPSVEMWMLALTRAAQLCQHR